MTRTQYESTRKDMGYYWWCTTRPKVNPADPDAVMLLKESLSDVFLSFRADAAPRTLSATLKGEKVVLMPDQRKQPDWVSFALPWTMSKDDKVSFWFDEANHEPA